MQEASEAAVASALPSRQLAAELATDFAGTRYTADGGPVHIVLRWSHTSAMKDPAWQEDARWVRSQVSRGLHPDVYGREIARVWAYVLALSAIEHSRGLNAAAQA